MILDFIKGLGGNQSFKIDLDTTSIEAAKAGISETVKAMDDLTESQRQNLSTQIQSTTQEQMANAARSAGIGITKSATLAEKALRAAKLATNVALTAGLSIIGGMLVSGFVKYLYDVANAEKIVAENAENAKNTIKNLNDTFKDQKSYIEENIDAYEELSKGVDLNTNQNISLTTEEYDKFLEINNKIAEISPVLSKGLDDNGNALINLSENGNTATESLKELLVEMENTNNIKIAEQIPDLFAGVRQQIDQTKEAIEEYENDTNNLQSVQEQLNTFMDGINIGDMITADIDMSSAQGSALVKTLGDSINQFIKEATPEELSILNEAGGFIDTFNSSDINEDGIYEFYVNTYALTEEQKRRLSEIISNNSTELLGLLIDSNGALSSEQAKLQKEAESEWKDFLPSLVSAMESKTTFKELERFGEDVQDVVRDIVGNLSLDTAYQMGEDPYDWIRNNIILPLESLSDSDRNELVNAYNQLFDFNIDDSRMTIEEAQEYINSIIEQIANILGQNPVDLKLQLGIDTEFISAELQEKSYEIQRQAAEIFSDRTIADYNVKFEDINEAMRDNSINTENELIAWNNALQEAIDKHEDLNYAIEQYRQIIKSINADELLSFGDTIEELDALSDGFNSIDEAYADFADGNKDTNIGFEDFANLNEELSNIEGIDEYIKAIQDAEGNTEATQEAFDNLATAYVNQMGILDMVNEENQKLVNTWLEEMGVANSNELVQLGLARAKAESAWQSQDLTNATYEEISALADEIGMTGEARRQFELYIAQKLVNEPISTVEDIDNLANIVNALGIATEAWQRYYAARREMLVSEKAEVKVNAAGRAYREYQTYDSTGRQVTKRSYDLQYDQLQREAENAQKDLETYYDDIVKMSEEAAQVSYSGGSSTKSAINKAGGSKKEEEPKEPQVFDWMPEQIENLNEEIEKLEANMESVAGFKLKNKYVDDIIADLEKEIGLYDQMTAKYQERLDSIGLAQEYINKIQNGTMQIEDIADTDGNQVLIQQIEDYQKWYDELENCNSSVIEIKQRIEELRFQKLDNIIDEFDTLESSISDCVNTQEELMSLMEQTGEEISFEDYEKLAERQTELAKLNAQYYDELKEEMDRLNIQEGSEEWEKYNSQLEEFKQNIISCGQAVEDYKDEIFELTFKELDDFNSKLDEVNNTISTMRDLIGDEGLVTEEGLTDRGLVQVALYAQELANAQKQSAEYVEAMEALDEALDSGLITQEEYNEALSEYRSGQESAVQAAKQAQAAIIQIVKDGIQAQIDAKTEEINATKEQLDAEKELNDYRESITDKSNQIAVLQKQIATLSLSTDRRDLAQRLELQEKLADLQKEMYNEQADHALEEQQDALDEELENYTEAKESEMEELDTNLDKQTEAINEYLEQVKTNYNTVYAILNEYGDAYSLSAIEDLTAPWDSGKDAADLCSEAIGNVCAEINYEIENIDASPIYDLINAFKELIDLEYGAFDGFGTGGVSNRYEDVTDQGKWQKNDTGWWYGNSDDDYVANGIYTINGKQYGFNKDGYMKTGWHEIDGTWYYFEPENGQMVKSTWRKSKDGGDYYLTADGTMATNAAVKDKDDDNTYYYVDGSGRWDGFELSKDQVEELKYDIAYRKGTKNARPGIALTDEEGLGSEVVITKYGALRQLDSGDSVFNAEQVKNLHALSAVNGLPDKIASLARNLTKNVMYNNNGLNITSPLIQIDGTGLSSAEVASLISAQVDDLPTRIMRAIKYNLR